jgi:hypothetical protein
MRVLGEGCATEPHISRRTFFGGYYIKETHNLRLCACSFCCKVANNPLRGNTQFWAPALKYWLKGWWVYVQVRSDGYVIYTRYTLPFWADPIRWF